jgi:hypothetical protein
MPPRLGLHDIWIAVFIRAADQRILSCASAICLRRLGPLGARALQTDVAFIQRCYRAKIVNLGGNFWLL